MCGICGIFGKGNRDGIDGMVSAMSHRGPDDSGVYRDDDIAMGMTRLAIIDITPCGHQPMSNDAKSVWIVYNGETYNFKAERSVLEEKGYTFKSDSDTEVVLRMYEHYGDDFLLRMRGMFGLAVYDKRKGAGKERLLLARDHLGIKPLLYANARGRFIFASEIKSILASGLIDAAIDPESLRMLLTYGSIVQPRTIIKGVKMLLPGHRLIIQSGGERLERYWRLGTGRVPALKTMDYNDLVSEVKSAIVESVRLQMVSDVPIGAFLSGGVDSSLLVALMSRESKQKVKTFSVGYESEGSHMDESSDAMRTAAYIGTDHTNVIVSGSDVRDRISHIARSLDQPSVDGVNSYFVSMAAKQSVTVAVSGTGGDELFAGYPWFAAMSLAAEREREAPLKSFAQKGMSWVVNRPLSDNLMSGNYGEILEFIRAKTTFIPRYVQQYHIFGTRGAAKMLSPEIRISSNAGRSPLYDLRHADEIPDASIVERVSVLCLRHYTQNQLLRDIDATSMAHSLEVRVPLLDHVLADIALSLPSDVKLNVRGDTFHPKKRTYRDTGAKRILIDVGKGILPEDMDLQEKRGFGMPFDFWLKNQLRDVLEDSLSQKKIQNRGLFDASEVERIKENFFAGRSSYVYPWLLMMIELWIEEVLDSNRAHARA